MLMSFHARIRALASFVIIPQTHIRSENRISKFGAVGVCDPEAEKRDSSARNTEPQNDKLGQPMASR